MKDFRKTYLTKPIHRRAARLLRFLTLPAGATATVLAC